MAIDNDWSEAERRQYERYSADFHLAVYQGGDAVPLGDLVDISKGGMRLLSDKPVPTGVRFDLVLDVALESGLTARVPIEAESVWGKEDDNPGFYQSGFKFLALSQQAAETIDAIIAELQ